MTPWVTRAAGHRGLARDSTQRKTPYVPYVPYMPCMPYEKTVKISVPEIWRQCCLKTPTSKDLSRELMKCLFCSSH
jgi:hypothetical protein